MNSLREVKILIVDDEPHILQFLEIGLINEGYIVKKATDGVSTINLAQEFPPHVAIFIQKASKLIIVI